MTTLTESIRESMNVLNENFDWQTYHDQYETGTSIEDKLKGVVGGLADAELIYKIANYFEEGFHGTSHEMMEDMPIVKQLGGPDTDEGTDAGFAYYIRALEIFLLNSHHQTEPDVLRELAQRLKSEVTDKNFLIPFEEISLSIEFLQDYNY